MRTIGKQRNTGTSVLAAIQAANTRSEGMYWWQSKTKGNYLGMLRRVGVAILRGLAKVALIAIDFRGTSIWRSVSLAACAMVIVVILPTAVHADGTYRWQNEADRNYLEIWQSSTQNQGWVITWPLNTASPNQWWVDQKVETSYYRIMNYNSGKFLDRWDDGTFRGGLTGKGYLCTYPMQWSWTGQNWQRWRYRSMWSYHTKRNFSLWINKHGSCGNPYQDALAIDGENSPYTGLMLESDCNDNESNQIIFPGCWWRRNGQ